ncbi:hypothetical protein [Pusillimonas noertemannii]|uniref:hypothetical protein n=1 Tax=Pusillimonas noertemannii TaxID=305977 RepID=UPI000E59A826|nr:hypothetical protein [Pusillimonas noertemannii]NYT67701.1 hypothetical protein [Pusillimonas noertemannii]TFL12143.1 hypothetical protein CSC72_03205 [Pusillimonas noertemannii]
MDKHLQECLEHIAKPIERAVMDGRVSGAPFVDFTNQASMVFSGVETIVELLQIDTLREGYEEEEHRRLSARQKGALLELIRSVSRTMTFRVSDIADWADQRMKEKGMAQ